MIRYSDADSAPPVDNPLANSMLNIPEKTTDAVNDFAGFSFQNIPLLGIYAFPAIDLFP